MKFLLGVLTVAVLMLSACGDKQPAAPVAEQKPVATLQERFDQVEPMPAPTMPPVIEQYHEDAAPLPEPRQRKKHTERLPEVRTPYVAPTPPVQRTICFPWGEIDQDTGEKKIGVTCRWFFGLFNSR